MKLLTKMQNPPLGVVKFCPNIEPGGGSMLWVLCRKCSHMRVIHICVSPYRTIGSSHRPNDWALAPRPAGRGSFLGPRRASPPRLEFADGGTLADYVRAKAKQKGHLSAARVQDFAAQLATALAFIHERGVGHQGEHGQGIKRAFVLDKERGGGSRPPLEPKIFLR